MKLPESIEIYVRAENDADVDANDICFSPDATARDEGHIYEGLAEIKRWKAESKRKYNHTMEPFEVSERDGRIVVASRVTGDFPGSPITLHSSFLLKDGKILTLETI
jgi:hypothetical protein